MSTRDALAGLEQDLRFAVRTLARTPGLTIVAIASLTIGLGLTAVTTATVNAYLVASLPYAEADRLYRVRYAPPGPWEPRGISLLDWTSVKDVVEFPITSVGETLYLSDGGFAQSARGLRVGRGFIAGLGVRAALGRTLEGADFDAAGAQSALIGHGLWRDRYGADPDVIGRVISVEAESGRGAMETVRIVGVLPHGFYFGRDSREGVDLLVPLTSAARTYMARLPPGVPVDAAERRITEAARQVATDLPPDWSGVELESVREQYVAPLRPVLLGVTFACALVLLIVGANVAVLMLLRTLRRQKEFAVRAALGAGRWASVRMLLIEAACLCGVGLVLAVAATALTIDSLAPLIERQLGRPAPGGDSAIAIHGPVLLIVGGIGLALAFAVSLLPLLTPWQRRPAETLRHDAWTGTSGHPMRLTRSALIALEIAGTLVLLVASVLVVSAVVGMLQADLGFEPDRLVRARVVLRGSDYPDTAAFSRFYREFTHRLGTALKAPVVFTNWPPFTEPPTELVEAAGQPGQSVPAGVVSVGAGYFDALGAGLRAGRDFSVQDAEGADPAVAVSETLARRLWPDGGGLGQQIRVVERTPDGSRAGPWRNVVAIAADVRQTYSDTELRDVYIPRTPSGRFGSFYVRTDGAPAALLPDIRAVATEIDPRAMIDPPKSVASENRQLAGASVFSSLLVGFAAVATFLSVLGVYGVTAYAVAQRERETAIRIALGAPTGAVVRLFLKEGSVVLAGGLGFGMLGAIAAAKALESQVAGISAYDVRMMLPTVAVLASVATIATWWPARRGARRDPLDALKNN